MSSIVDRIVENAKKCQLSCVYSEGYDERIVKAAYEAKQTGLVKEAIVLGTFEEVEEAAKKAGVNAGVLTVINPKEDSRLDDFAKKFVELRKAKGKEISFEDAKNKISDNVFFAAMMLKEGYADVSVNGAVYSTGTVIVAAAQVLGTAENVDIISSSMLMIVPNFLDTNEPKIFVFGDCAVVPNPNPSQLASIAYSCASMYKKLVNDEPKVAMLSFSTKGSGKHPDVDKVIEATKLAKERYPELQIDGELQLDAAIVPSVAKRKAPDSDVAGNANVLIFPDLDAGNIGYKLTERLAKAEAIGPILQGVSKPFMDLSRGCKWQDVYNVTAIAINLA